MSNYNALQIPLFGDQPRNSRMLARLGGGITLQKTDIGEPEVMKQAIMTILQDNR